MSEQTETKNLDFISIVKSKVNKQYPALETQEKIALSREIIFAPSNYVTELNETPIAISSIRENLANGIENNPTEHRSITYTLESEIADLIEKSNCETSSMNEYYRWIADTADILSHTTDDNVSRSEYLENKNDFIRMSYDREAEILLCLALYEGNKTPQNIEKSNLLRFKLARLREMRSIIKNTPKTISVKETEKIAQIRSQYNYCINLLQEKPDFAENINQILKININDMSDEDLEEDFSYISYVQSNVLHMMHDMEKPTTENQRSEQIIEKSAPGELSLGKISIRESEGR